MLFENPKVLERAKRVRFPPVPLNVDTYSMNTSNHPIIDSLIEDTLDELTSVIPEPTKKKKLRTEDSTEVLKSAADAAETVQDAVEASSVVSGLMG